MGISSVMPDCDGLVLILTGFEGYSLNPNLYHAIWPTVCISLFGLFPECLTV